MIPGSPVKVEQGYRPRTCQRIAEESEDQQQWQLHLVTRFDWTRLIRRQMQDAGGVYCCPLDALLGLASWQRTSPWITSQAVHLATRLPFSQATCLLGAWVQAPIHHRSLYRWVQKAGAQLAAEEDELQTAVFIHGEIPHRHDREREIVLAEVDGTFLRDLREEGPPLKRA
jgi:hypothetical protein